MIVLTNENGRNYDVVCASGTTKLAASTSCLLEHLFLASDLPLGSHVRSWVPCWRTREKGPGTT